MKLTRTLFFFALSLLAVAGSAGASLIFFDDFDQDAADNGSVLSFNGFDNWTVDSGTVDLVANGGFGLTCAGSTGGCVDLDGSSNDAGRLYSNDVFSLASGTWYQLSVDISGNQTGVGLADGFSYGFLTPGLGALSTSSHSSIQNFDPFHTFTFVIQWSLADTDVRLFVAGDGNDNFGPILDNVTFCSAGSGSDPQADCAREQVPEPATAVLFGLAAATVAVRRRFTRRA